MTRMYSVRKTTVHHGNTNVNILVCNVVITALLAWQFGTDYLVIFCSSGLLHLLIESGLSLSGLRKGSVYVFGHKLPRVADVFLRSFVEGPSFCVSSFFAADQIMGGNLALGIAGPVLVVGLASFYMGWADRRDIRCLKSGEEPLISRRAMTNPVAVILLAVINTLCLIAILMIPLPFRTHAIIYISSYGLLVILFYILNYPLGVRYVELYDNEKKEFRAPGPLVQALGLTYDSVYEMGLLISPAYWVTFYFGLFHYDTIA